MIAREDAGFFGRLEDVVLFEEDDFTGQFPTLESIDAKLEDQGLERELDKLDRLQLKRTFFNVRSSFPYDFVNLDFCEYYYPHPPGMLRVNRTIERFLDWQGRTSEDGENIQLGEFILAVTCRYDVDFPGEAEARLKELIRNNCRTSAAYKEQVEETRGTAEVERWIEIDQEDFFFAGWPKDIALSARNRGWSMEILDYVYYRRKVGQDDPYVIACLVAKFVRSNPVRDYVATALFALDKNNRQLIDEIDRNSSEGQHLLQNLSGIVALHNEQARLKQRPELPDP
jgi:predicted DNA-binding protein